MSVDEIVNGIVEQSNLIVDEKTGGTDNITLREVTNTITVITSKLLGIALVVIVISVPIIVTLELIYVNFPIIRTPMDALYNKLGSKGVSRRALGLVLGDARKAVEQANTVKTGRNATLVYIGIKVKSVMMITFIVAIIGLGSGTLVNLVLDMFSGVIKMLLGI